jgi:hypothetical protein
MTLDAAGAESRNLENARYAPQRAITGAAHAMMTGVSAIMAFRSKRLWVNVGRTTLVAAVLAGGFTVWYRATYHAFPGQQVPRVHWCGRDYSIQDSPQTWRQISAVERSPIRAVGQYPPLVWWGQEVFAPSLPVMPHGPGEPCAIEVYLRTGQDIYQAYVLEGGFRPGVRKTCPRDVTGPPSTANDRHQQQPVHDTPANGLQIAKQRQTCSAVH